MVNSFANGKTKLVEPPYGSYVDSWQLPVNSNFGVTDAAVSGTTTINVSTLTAGLPYVTLTFNNFDTSPTPWMDPLSGQNLRILLTGSLSFNVTLFIPQNVPGFWFIDNQASGNFSVFVKTTNPASVGVVAPASSSIIVYCDGTNIKLADGGNTINSQFLVPTGSVISFAGNAGFPAGYLNCDGSAVSRATYAGLFNVIGTSWGVGDGSTTFNLPQLQNMFQRGAGGSNPAGYYEAASFAAHTHSASVSDPGHLHSNYHSQSVSGAAGFVGGGSPNQGTGPFGTYPATTGVGVSIGSAGGSETRPENYRLWFLIKT